MKLTNIAILFGGQSTEHEVSRRSAMTVLSHLPAGYNALPIGITKDGQWFAYDGDFALIPGGEWEQSPKKRLLCFRADGLYTEEGKLDIDAVFPVLHGKNGEDGTVQGLLELMGIPYVGSRVGASACGMDKSMTKLLVQSLGIEQAPFVLVDKFTDEPLCQVAIRAEAAMPYPMFVKPCKSGSSVGVSKVSNRDELLGGLENALLFDDRVLVEKGINARELECAVLYASGRFVAEVGEVISALDYYDYEAKYNNPSSRTELYPDITPKVEAQIKASALSIFKCLDCAGLARVDFFLDRDTGRVVFNEINTMPGFTSISMFPMLMKKHGMTETELIGKLIESAE